MKKHLRHIAGAGALAFIVAASLAAGAAPSWSPGPEAAPTVPAAPSAGPSAAPPAPPSRVDFLIPGISLESLSLGVGARVSYLVVTHTFGAADSSFIEIRVLGRAGKEYSLEITSSPYPKSIEASMRVRIRVSEGITRVSSPAGVRSMIREILVRNGSEPYRAPTAEELKEADVENLFTRPAPEATRTELGTDRVSSPAGTFLCSVVEYSSTDRRKVTLGGVEADRVDTETSRVWLSKEVPFWGVARSRVERTSRTSVVGGSPGAGAPKTTLTESIILSFRRPRARG